MDKWDLVCEEREQISKVHQLLDRTGEFVFFFEFEKSVYGAPEDSRIVFAKLKHPDEDMVGKAKEEANFIAVNLDKIIEGQGTQRIFGIKDVGKIHVIDKETAAEKLGKKAKEDD
jgi:hypothetical protein